MTPLSRCLVGIEEIRHSMIVAGHVRDSGTMMCTLSRTIGHPPCHFMLLPVFPTSPESPFLIDLSFGSPIQLLNPSSSEFNRPSESEDQDWLS